MIVNEISLYKNSKDIEFDVAVIGGGIAGIAAALSASRLGSKVLLADSSFMLGGLATSGLVTIYLPLCDGMGHQLSYGIAEELLKLSISLGAEADYPHTWLDSNNEDERRNNRYLTRFNPHVFAILCEKLLLKCGVNILYGATLVDAEKDQDGHRIKSVSLATNVDMYVIRANTFIDCTGDANLAYLAGVPVAYPDHKNANAAWYYEVFEGKYNLKTIGSCAHHYTNDYTTGVSGLDGLENTREMIFSHEHIIDDFLKNGSVSKEHSIATIPTIPQVRMTRRIKGIYELKKTDDKIYIESSSGMFGSWVEKGPAFELPIETLFSDVIKNLCVAGRCISVADDTMWDITRVIPVCAVTGEAAGILASVSSDFCYADYKNVQKKLVERNVKIHLNEVGITID